MKLVVVFHMLAVRHKPVISLFFIAPYVLHVGIIGIGCSKRFVILFSTEMICVGA